MGLLTGKTALVTGAARGIGKASQNSSCLREMRLQLLFYHIFSKMTTLFLLSLTALGSEFHTQLVVQILQDLLHVAVHCLCGEFFLLRSKGYGECHGLLLGSYL